MKNIPSNPCLPVSYNDISASKASDVGPQMSLLSRSCLCAGEYNDPTTSRHFMSASKSHCKGKTAPNCTSGLGQRQAYKKPHSFQPHQWRELPACRLRRMLDLSPLWFFAKALWDHHAKIGGLTLDRLYEGYHSRQAKTARGWDVSCEFQLRGTDFTAISLSAAWFGKEARYKIRGEAAAFTSPA